MALPIYAGANPVLKEFHLFVTRCSVAGLVSVMRGMHITVCWVNGWLWMLQFPWTKENIPLKHPTPQLGSKPISE